MNNKEDKLKTLVIECGAEFMTAAQTRKLGSDKSDITRKYYKKLKKLINSHYISRDKILNLECLKEEKFNSPISDQAYPYRRQEQIIRNQLRKEIKEAINNLK